MMMKRAMVGIAAVFLVTSGNLNAATILFNFDSIPDNTNSTGNTIGTGGVVDPIETYMEGLYGSDITVDWGARAEDDRTEGLTTNYAYLGSTNGAIDRLGTCGTGPCAATNPDRFLINRWNSSTVPATLRDRITITFEIVPITGLEFDWEIFPVTQSGQNADFTVRVWTQQQLDDEGAGTVIFFTELLGASKPLGDMGHQSFTFSDPITRISLIDWNDAPIGVDNLRITQTPVPGTLVLLGAGLLALGIGRARGRSKKPESSSPTSN